MNDHRCRSNVRDLLPTSNSAPSPRSQHELSNAEFAPEPITRPDVVDRASAHEAPTNDGGPNTNGDVRAKYYWLNPTIGRQNCRDEVFNRWSSVYELTIGQTGQQILEQRADCRRKPFYPRRCEICDTVDNLYVSERFRKQRCKTKPEPFLCYGDYIEGCPTPQHPHAMIANDPRKAALLQFKVR